MVAELLQRADTVGVTRVSLNFAMFRAAFEQGAQLGAGPVARLWRALLVFFSRWWQLETLYRSNMKYEPQWVPRFACYEDTRLIPGWRGLGYRRRLPGAAVLAPEQATHRSPLSGAARHRGNWRIAHRRQCTHRGPGNTAAHRG